MNYLSLFSGVGGGDLASQHLLKHRCVGYVEFNDYCQRVIKQRIKDGHLDEAPIFGDIKTFIGEGYADSYKGMVDIITGGFPCQPFSVAGKGRAEKDERNMWPQTIDVIRRVRPGFLLLENVPGLAGHEYFIEIMRGIAESGYEAFPPLILGADDVSAPHRRKRLWIVACAAFKLPHRGRDIRPTGRGKPASGGEDVADSKVIGIQRNWSVGEQEPQTHAGQRLSVCNSSGNGMQNWPTEPELGRVAHGVANRVDRLKAIGNGQVPRVAATAWQLLTGGCRVELS